GPSIEAAISNGGQIIRYQIRAKLIALVDDGPQRMSLRLELQPVRIAQPGGVLAMRPGGPIDLPDCCAANFRLNAVLRDVAVGADACIELSTVRARRQTLRPVMVDRAARQ